MVMVNVLPILITVLMGRIAKLLLRSSMQVIKALMLIKISYSLKWLGFVQFSMLFVNGPDNYSSSY